MIEFVPRVAPNRHAERVQFLFASPMDGDVVALFSGGLDSLAGLAADIDAGVNPIALSIESNTKIAKSQRDVLEHLNNALNTSISRVPIGLHLRSVPGTEQSQRARGFGFLALAGALAVLTGRDLIHVYENGIGAINLPYTSAQTGAHGTRAMHPATLNMATVLLSAALDSTLQIVNRSQYKTKAEMCAALPSSLYSAVAATETCDTAFTYRGSGALSCGRCTSCLLRRQALAASKLTTLDPASNYRLDAFSESEAPYQLRAMLSQASRIHRAIGARTSCTWAALIGEFPDLVGIAHSLNVGPGEKAEVGLIDLLQRYVKEWAEVPSPLVASYLGHDYVAA
jgi:7-cyano-7-deazaguanine synthase in queuosine biosynthesis